jgi:transcriptional regulator with XRE-family HTH domain
MSLVYPNGKALRELREKQVLSYDDLSRKADLSGSTTLRKIEHSMPCRVETMRKLLLALGVDLVDASNYRSYKRD